MLGLVLVERVQSAPPRALPLRVPLGPPNELLLAALLLLTLCHILLNANLPLLRASRPAASTPAPSRTASRETDAGDAGDAYSAAYTDAYSAPYSGVYSEASLWTWPEPEELASSP